MLPEANEVCSLAAAGDVCGTLRGAGEPRAVLFMWGLCSKEPGSVVCAWNGRSQFPFCPVRSKNTSGVFLASSF